MSFDNYEKYLEIIMSYIDKRFEEQAEYICCSEGCAGCCKTDVRGITYTDLEFEYLTYGFEQLDENTKTKILENLEKMFEEKSQFSCPFLLNNRCSVYKYRSLICRTFGLLITTYDEESVIPFCIHQGLNYSKVYDKKTNKISAELVEKGNYKVEPKFFPFNKTLLCNLNIVKELGIDFKGFKNFGEYLEEWYNNLKHN